MGGFLSRTRRLQRPRDRHPVQSTENETGDCDGDNLFRILLRQQTEVRECLLPVQQPGQERVFDERYWTGQLSEEGYPVRHPTDEDDSTEENTQYNSNT